MDELENVVTLSDADARLLRGNQHLHGDNVVIAAGQKGILHCYYFSMLGISKDAFSIKQLFSLPISPLEQGNELNRIVRLSYIASQSMLLVASADQVIYFYNMYGMAFSVMSNSYTSMIISLMGNLRLIVLMPILCR